jgi:hypothetical protein
VAVPARVLVTASAARFAQSPRTLKWQRPFWRMRFKISSCAVKPMICFGKCYNSSRSRSSSRSDTPPLGSGCKSDLTGTAISKMGLQEDVWLGNRRNGTGLRSQTALRSGILGLAL